MLANPLILILFTGAEGQNRTADTGIFSPLLYRLSYLGMTLKKSKIIRPPFFCQDIFWLISPKRYCSTTHAATVAVSALKIRGPNPAVINP